MNKKKKQQDTQFIPPLTDRNAVVHWKNALWGTALHDVMNDVIWGEFAIFIPRI